MAAGIFIYFLAGGKCMGWLWFAAIAAVVSFVWAILASRVRLEVLFSREGEDDLFRVKAVALGGLFRYKFEVSAVDWAGIGAGLALKRETVNLNKEQVKSEQRQQITRRTILAKYEQMRNIFTHTSGFYRWLQSSMSRMHCDSVDWKTNVGLGDAPETALTCGFIWSVKSSILGYLFRYIKLHQTPKMVVNPLFNREYFETRFTCRLSIRLGMALLAGIQLLIRILRVKGGLKVWRRVLSKS